MRQRVPPTTRAGRPQTVILIQGDTLRHGPPRRLRLRAGDRADAASGWREEGALFQQRDHPDELDQGGDAVDPDLALPVDARRPPDPRPPAGLGHDDRRGLPRGRLRDARRSRRWPSPASSRNLHQGFEELHESESTAGRAGPRGRQDGARVRRPPGRVAGRRTATSRSSSSSTSSIPHSPYEPNRPYDTLWADPKGREEYLRQQEVLKKFVADAFLAQRGMATRDELPKAGLDPAAFIRYSKDWYDGSIRGHGRARSAGWSSGCEELGLRDRALPRLLRRPRRGVPRPRPDVARPERLRRDDPRAADPVGARARAQGHARRGAGAAHRRHADAARPERACACRAAAQGQSLRPLLAGPAGGAVAAARGLEAAAGRSPRSSRSGGDELPRASESYAIMDGDWKLIHNVVAAAREAGVRAVRLLQGPARPEERGRRAPGGRGAAGQGARRLAQHGAGGAAEARQRGTRRA